MSTNGRKIRVAGIFWIAAATAIVLFLFRLSQPDKACEPIYLNCMESNRGGWRFYTETDEAEPVFGLGGYIDGIPAEGDGPVVAERVMGNPGARCFLQFNCFDTALQVFLDGTLLYTDFPQKENRVDRFLTDVNYTGISYDGLRIPLPKDCTGKTLRIVTYGSSVNGLRQPIFPMQVGRFSDAVVQTTGVIWPMADIIAKFLLALCLMLVVVIGTQAGESLWKLLPLSGYFLLAGVSVISHPIWNPLRD